jgi:DNA-directed RNA polymerase specialized sigma24 family protein
MRPGPVRGAGTGGRWLYAGRREHPGPADADGRAGTLLAAEKELLAAERHAALRDAFARLPGGCQQLMALLIADPPVPYAQIGATLGIPVGSIGPRRRRCLEKLRRDPAIAALVDPDAVESHKHAAREPSHTSTQLCHPSRIST